MTEIKLPRDNTTPINEFGDIASMYLSDIDHRLHIAIDENILDDVKYEFRSLIKIDHMKSYIDLLEILYL